MQYKSFTIKNFKGIKNIEFNIKSKPDARMFTFVGLNESGKTTILEAISYWYETIGKTEEEFLHTTGIDDPRTLIPRSEQFNFSDSIEISAEIIIEDSDKEEIEKICKAHGFGVDWAESKGTLSYILRYNFSMSRLEIKNTSRYVTADVIRLTKERTVNKRRRTLDRTWLSGKDKGLWDEFCDFIKIRIRPIIYYPNFLFEFPDRIYIDGLTSNDPKQNFYYKFLQDILDSIGDGLTIKDSLLERFLTQDQTDQKSLRSLTNRMSSALNGLMKSLDLFNFKSGQRNVIVNGPYEDSGVHYIQVQIQEADDTYDIRERSLGFRWFFTFALLTQFRIRRANGSAPIFIFDEPASNLHQTYQQRLLKALEHLTENDKSTVIYATHSHHLIDPTRLENTYIVKNQGMKSGDDPDYIASMTDIKMFKYREFVNQNPNDKDYFQPILDVLEYKPSDLENVDHCIIVEGKNDFYTLKILNAVDSKYSVIPGFGVDKLETILALYFGWGKNFIVILDSDKAGVDKKSNFIKRYGPIIEDRIFTLEDIYSEWSGKTMEDLFNIQEKMIVQKISFPDDPEYVKQKFNVALQEALAKKITLEISSPTTESFNIIRRFISDKLK